VQRASETAQPHRAEHLGANASAAAFVVALAACWVWVRFSAPGDDPLPWHSVNALLAGAGAGTAAWAVVASRRRWLALLVVVPLLLLSEAYLLRWEWALYIWRTRGFAP
jgi:hypothetical protein